MINHKNNILKHIIVFIGMAISCALKTYAQVEWKSRIPPDPPRPHYDAIAGNGSQTIMVGDSGRYLYSGDGITWTHKIMEPSTTLRSIIWNGTQFIAVGFDALNYVAFTSPDGIAWTKRNMGTFPGGSPTYLFIATSGINIVVEVEEGTFFTSQDGVSWVKKNAGQNGDIINGLIWAGTQYVAVGASSKSDSSVGIVFTSPDGLTWKRQLSHTKEFTHLVAWTGKQIVAVPVDYETGLGGMPILTSSDGIHWTATRSLGNLISPKTMLWTGKQLVLTSSFRPWTSLDGLTWVEQKWIPDESVFPERANSYTSGIDPEILTWTGKQLIAVEKSGNMFTSVDAVSWKSVKGLASAPHLYSVVSSGNKILAVGEDGTVLNSPDGITWTATNSGTNQSLRSIIWTGTHFVAVGDSGTILFSTDGLAWTPRASGTYHSLRSVIWTGTKFVAAGVTGTLLTSTDGISWKQESSGTLAALNSLCMSDTQLVAIGEGWILTSPDGTTWTTRLKNQATWFLGISWTGTHFVTIGDRPSIFHTSPDGKSWVNPIINNVTGEGTSITWTGSQLVAVSRQNDQYRRSNDILTSSDGITWKATGILPGTDRVNSIIWTGTQFIAVGNFKTIYTSPLNSPTVIVDQVSLQRALSIRIISTSLYVSLPDDFLGDKIKVSIYATSGKKVFDGMGCGKNGEMVLPLSDLNSGRYLLEVKGKRVSRSKSFHFIHF